MRLAVAIGALGAVLGVLGQCSVWADPPSGVRPRPIPEFQRCPTGEAACPGYGTAGDSGYVDFASVGNPCGGVTTIAITPTSVTLVTAPVRDTCPLFYRIIPDCGRTIGKPGCCITRLEDREVLEQRLRCRCVSSFLLLFCRRFSCEPEGDLHGAGWLYDCADATPCDPEAGADCNERRSASDR